ncbi:alpha/beta fold hydrolase [Nocardia brasiliensis]|uniref:alpha/beta fold hydrolase n=1 Tax=Nocardia brasiliensis TaxID=37326 RepID=UPI001EEA5038|nr:alpha/beta fold hydrolase [Nocardia brasiliensis]
MSDLVVRTEGAGPPVALVHGGAGPKSTWAGLDSLADRWTVLQVYRRGYDPSPPPPNGHQDFLVDAADLTALFRTHRPHVVAHSYGTLGAVLAAAADPRTVRSLTLIEPPLYVVAPDDPEVVHLERLGDAVLTHGLDADPEVLREFLALSGAPGVDAAQLPDPVVASVRRALGARLPGEAHPDWSALRAAEIPTLVASGGHTPALERICDALAEVTHAQRLIAPGAGHFVAAAPGFADQLAHFLAAHDAR